MRIPRDFPGGSGGGRVVRAVEWADRMRRSPFAVGGPGSHKEWLHFVVHADGLDVLVNFSVVDDVRERAAPGAELPRVVVLAKDRGRDWDGAIELFHAPEVRIEAGGLDLAYGPNSVEFRDGVFHIHVRLRHRPVAMDLVLRPQVVAAPCHNIRFELDRRPIHWMVLPRLLASGEVRLDGRTHRFEDAPAYHDHNWGHFEWGGDFAWEWGFALPVQRANPWTLVYVRLSDRARTRCYKQGLFLWKGESVARIFRGAEMRVGLEGLLRTPSLFKLPGIMQVIDPGSDADVPRAVACDAGGDGDRAGFRIEADDVASSRIEAYDVASSRIEADDVASSRIEADDVASSRIEADDVASFRFEADDVAQVCIPNDTDDDGITIINEVSGHLRAEGRIDGVDFALDGPGMFEFVRGA